MTEVSALLRAARERAGLSVEEISSRTKIATAQLLAMERGEFERLPGEFFARAFLRNYAREVGLSPDDVVRAYDAERAPVAAEETEDPVGPTTTSESGPPSSWRFRLPAPRALWPLGVLVAAIVGMIAVNSRTAPVVSEPLDTIGTTGVLPAGGPTGGATPDTRATRAPVGADRLKIEIRPTGAMWVTATADGKRVVYRLMQPGERVILTADSEFTFRVGDAGAFEYSMNGAPARTLGEPGEVRQFRITRQNVEAFLR